MRLCWSTMLMLVLAVGKVGASSAALPVVRADLYVSYTDNLFQNANRRADWMNMAYVDLDWMFGADWDLYYTGNVNAFAEYDDLFSHTHQLGVSYAWNGPEGQAVYAGFTAGARLNRALYDYRDYLQMEAHVSGKTYLRQALLARGGYRARMREYTHAEGFSFVEQTAHAQFSRFLPTRTTLIAGGEVGVKSFLRAAGPDPLTESLRTRAGGDRHLGQLVLRLKAAQALAAQVGLQLEYRRRVNLHGDGRYAELEYDPNGELFDDRYSYEGSEWRGALKWAPGRGWTMNVSGSSVEREYAARPALDMEGYELGETRADQRTRLLVEVTRRFAVSGSALREVELLAEWVYADVDSNDPYYRTEARTYSAGVRLGF